MAALIRVSGSLCVYSSPFSVFCAERRSKGFQILTRHRLHQGEWDRGRCSRSSGRGLGTAHCSCSCRLLLPLLASVWEQLGGCMQRRILAAARPALDQGDSSSSHGLPVSPGRRSSHLMRTHSFFLEVAHCLPMLWPSTGELLANLFLCSWASEQFQDVRLRVLYIRMALN